MDLQDDAKPSHQRAYPVPKANMAVFKTELDNLVRHGVTRERTGRSGVTFVVPKKGRQSSQMPIFALSTNTSSAASEFPHQ
jgi:hypothetical protein